MGQLAAWAAVEVVLPLALLMLYQANYFQPSPLGQRQERRHLEHCYRQPEVRLGQGPLQGPEAQELWHLGYAAHLLRLVGPVGHLAHLRKNLLAEEELVLRMEPEGLAEQ